MLVKILPWPNFVVVSNYMTRYSFHKASFLLFEARKSKSDLFAEKLDVINSENRAVKNVLVTAISKMTDLMIHTQGNKEATPVQVTISAPVEKEEEPSRKRHKCSNLCPPYCCKLYDD